MKCSRAVQEWLKEVRLRHPDTGTATAYESDLHRMVAAMKVDSILGFTTEFLRDYFLNISAVGDLRASTLHRKMASVNEFAKWGVRERLWAVNPMATLPRVRRPKHLPRPFSRDESDRLIALELPPVERVVRALLFTTGLRVTPLCRLKIGDVDFQAMTMRAWVKGAKIQVLQIHPLLRDLLYEYTLAHSDLKGHSPLVAQKNGRPFHRRSIERMAAHWGVLAGVPLCFPHRFRHTFATRLLEEGVDVRVIKEALGHEDIASTILYTEVTAKTLVDAIRRLPWQTL